MTDAITKQILRQSLNLSYADIKAAHPSWPSHAIDDYLYKQTNINSLAANSQSSDDQVLKNTQDISENTENISINSRAIAANASAISDNTDDINTNASDIGTNASNLANHINKTAGAHSASAISYDNTASGLSAINVQAAVDEIDSDLLNHENSTAAHGASGTNIGTEDYAQPLVGGAVFLSASVDDAMNSTVSVDSPDATDLPTVLLLANETKADVNQLATDLNNTITQLNEFLANNKTAKQMDA